MRKSLEERYGLNINEASKSRNFMKAASQMKKIKGIIQNIDNSMLKGKPSKAATDSLALAASSKQLASLLSGFEKEITFSGSDSEMPDSAQSWQMEWEKMGM